MRSRPLIWLLMGVVLWVAGACLWRLNEQRPGRRTTSPPPRVQAPSAVSGALRSTPAALRTTPPALTQLATRGTLRLANTAAPPAQLMHRPTALVLENALLDTAQPSALAIPEHLRAQAEPGAYIVQSRTPLDDAFRARLQAAGAIIVAYIPNQAYLVRASSAVAQQLQTDAATQAVLPYEPYFKLKPPLLALAVEQQPLADNGTLNVLLFPDARPAALEALDHLGVQVLGEESSPFGPVLTVPSGSAGGLLPALARLPGVQAIELCRARVPANDLTRARIGVAANSVTPANYLGLTGTNVVVSVNDTGVDANQPDLQGRVLCDAPTTGVDTNGHGTHVAGIIAGSGVESLTVTNAAGSIMPPVSYQFRGLAPEAQIFAVAASPSPSPSSDSYLQEAAARTNALISNNSWHYANDNAYDLAAARYDAAVRDAVPEVTGSQPVLFVFGAGNGGNGADDGSGGIADTVQSPATAKNVLTVGAIEQPRHITNQVWQCATVNSTNVCQTNQPWLGLTQTNNAVAAFSSRGNVGVGLEGSFGRFKPDVVAPGTFVVSARSTEWDQPAYYGPANSSSNYFQVLSNLNNGLGPFYRYESGTSLAAAAASGTLALMQEFFQRLGRTNSPALMKALLINGARPLAAPGALQASNPTNSQGWGLINLTNSLPATLSNCFLSAAAPMQVFDQNPADALATGQSHTRFLSLSAAATNQPLRVTLVWTDPPGNPAAGLKLVNNLDLVVTNLDSGQVFFGNDTLSTNGFTRPWDTSTPPNLDMVNNVENIYVAPALATHYSVTVVARNVNVNAVTGQTNGVAQDYALVVGSGEGGVTNALTVTDTPIASASALSVAFLTNTFAPDQGVSGALLLNERVGGQGSLPGSNSFTWPGGPNGAVLVGLSNQWRFYVLTNDQNYNYGAFLTFQPANLALPRLGVNQTNLANATRTEADIDLYVSTDPGLLNLDPAVLAVADTALGRRGTGAVVYDYVPPGAVYYVGVKSEDQEAAQYAFMGVFSQLPFGQQDEYGTWVLQGINLPAAIPDASGSQPGVTNVVAIAPSSIPVRRVVVTNELSHQSFTNLLGTLSHGGTSVVLNNHSLPPGDPVPYDYTYIYEDNGEGDIPGAQAADGPGSLRDFIGQQGQGVWLLTMADTVLGQTGLVENLSIRLDPQTIVNGASHDMATNAFFLDFFDVPFGATNFTVCLNNDSITALPLLLYLRRGAAPTPTSYDQMLSINSPSGCASINLYTAPPLNAGRYYIGVFNPNAIPQTIRLAATVDLDPNGVAPVTYAAAGPIPILDDAVSASTIPVTDARPVLAVDVGVRIDHPRVSDLVLTLISPSGTRVLLDENRGGATPSGLGLNITLTNTVSPASSQGPPASTNVLSSPATSGNLAIDYDFWSEADTLHVYSGTNLTPGNLIFDSGPVVSNGTFNVTFSNNASGFLTLVIDEGRPITVWNYTATLTSPGYLYTTFTENRNLSVTPIKFAQPPFTNVTLDPVALTPQTGIYYLPEESLGKLSGEPAGGDWTLEVLDNVAGATNPQPTLVSWQLSFLFQNTTALPIALTSAAAQTNELAPGQIQYYTVCVPPWARFATNQLLAATAPLNLLFNQALPPTGSNSAPPDFALLSGVVSGSGILAVTGGSPALVPGQSYYLGVQNTNATTVTFTLVVSFDITSLASGVPAPIDLAAGLVPSYFSFDVSSDATAAAFQLVGLSANAQLVLSQGLPLPTLGTFDYGSFYPGSNSQQIILFPNSVPVPLSPGRWYLGAYNGAAGGVTGTVLATEYSTPLPSIISLSSGVPVAGNNAGSDGATDYYEYVVSTNAVRTDFEIDSPSGDVTLVARRGLPLPTLASYDCLSANPGTNEELITLFNFSAPVPLMPGDWFLSVVNVSGAPVSYTILATEFTDYGTNLVITSFERLTNNLCLVWTSLPGIHYYVQGNTDLSSSNWAAVSPTIVASDVQSAYCVGLPSPYHFFRVSEGLAVPPAVTPVSITSIARDLTGVHLQWLAPTNGQFQAQWSSSLAPAAWSAFTNILTSTNGTFSFLDDGSQSGGLAARRYYRLRQVP